MINSRTLTGIRGRPVGRDFHFQKEAKPFSMPANERIGLDDREEITPVEESGELCQCEPTRVGCASSLGLALYVQTELFAKE